MTLKLPLDYAVAGHGIAPCLAALALGQSQPEKTIAVLVSDRDLGGDGLELCLTSMISGLALQILEQAVVREWPGYVIHNADGTTRQIDSRICLVDPVQLWLELAERIGEDHCIASSGEVRHDDGRITWCDGDEPCAALIDLQALAPPQRESQIVGADVLAVLDLPVLADFSLADRGCDFLQYVPLGADRALINRYGDGRNRQTFGVEDLPTLVHLSHIAAICRVVAESETPSQP